MRICTRKSDAVFLIPEFQVHREYRLETASLIAFGRNLKYSPLTTVCRQNKTFLYQQASNS